MDRTVTAGGPLFQTTAIAVLCIRSAIRSRFVVCLVALLLLTIVGLPMTIEGDGTLSGHVQVLLRYTLGLAAVIIGTAVLWVACGSISQEIESRQIHLTVVKPVRRFQIWLGKWLGLLAVCAALLTVSGIAVYALLWWTVASSGANARDRAELRSEILVGRRRIRPRRESVHAEAHAYVERLVQSGRAPANQPLESAFLMVREQLLAAKQSVAPGGSKTWIFNLPAGLESSLRAEPGVVARFSFRSTSLTREPLKGTWTIAPENGPQLFSHSVDDLRDGRHAFDVPPAALPPGSLISITFTNTSPEGSGTAVFDSEAGIEFLVTEGSFERNLVMALAVVFCHLALLAAIGLTVSSMFSFPVATFVAASMLVVFAATHYFASDPITQGGCGHHHHGDPLEYGIVDAVGQKILRSLAVVVEPAMELDSLELLADGILVSGAFAGEALVLLLIVYPGLCGLAAGLCLSRRELALPAQ